MPKTLKLINTYYFILMRIIILLLIVFYIYACKEKSQEKEAIYPGFHVDAGLCVSKYRKFGHLEDKQYEWIIKVYSCYDSLPTDTATPIEDILKYRQGGLCLYRYNDCSIEPEKTFTLFINVPKDFIDANEYNVFASKYNDSTMLYKYEEKISNDTIALFKEYNGFWYELFSMAKPLKIKNEDFSDKCNSKFCATKDFLWPFYEIECEYGVERKQFDCSKKGYYNVEKGSSSKKIKPKCLDKLERLSKYYGILMHSGAFPAGDCDLSNWRYVKIDNLSKKHYEKLLANIPKIN